MGLPVREGLVRLVNFKPIFVDSQSPDFCVKRWSWEPQFGCRTTRPRDTARTFCQCGVNHFLFLPLQRAVERRCRTSEFWRLPFEPRLIHAKMSSSLRITALSITFVIHARCPASHRLSIV